METKVCTRCGIEKPLVEFTMNDRKRGYLKSACKACEKMRVKRFYDTHEEHREKVKVRSAQWAKDHPQDFAVIRRRLMLKKRFGISIEEHAALLEAQDGKCALCGAMDHGRNGNSRRSKNSHEWLADSWPVDHDHVTGRVRGLLCHKCNVRVGAYEALMAEVGEERLMRYLHPEPLLTPEMVERETLLILENNLRDAYPPPRLVA